MGQRRVIRKRRFPRRRFQQRIGILFQGKYDLSESVQIGEGGLMMKSPHSHKEGDQVVISFQVPGRDFIIVRASVQYKSRDVSGEMLYGMKFLNITFEDRRMLRDFISAKTEEEARQEGVFGQ